MGNRPRGLRSGASGKGKKSKRVKQKSNVAQVIGKQKAPDKDGNKKKSTYEPYRGPVVTSETYNLFKTPLERANAKRREEAHKRGQSMYKAKVLIPENDGVPAHYVWIDKFVQPQQKQESKEVQNNDGGNNKTDAPGEVQGVQGGSDSAESGAETRSEDIVSGVPD